MQEKFKLWTWICYLVRWTYFGATEREIKYYGNTLLGSMVNNIYMVIILYTNNIYISVKL